MLGGKTELGVFGENLGDTGAAAVAELLQVSDGGYRRVRRSRGFCRRAIWATSQIWTRQGRRRRRRRRCGRNRVEKLQAVRHLLCLLMALRDCHLDLQYVIKGRRRQLEGQQLRRRRRFAGRGVDYLPAAARLAGGPGPAPLAPFAAAGRGATRQAAARTAPDRRRALQRLYGWHSDAGFLHRDTGQHRGIRGRLGRHSLPNVKHHRKRRRNSGIEDVDNDGHGGT